MTQDVFSLNNYISRVAKNGRRMAKGYLYQVRFIFDKVSPTLKNVNPMTNETIKDLTFFCTKASIPGWRAKTEHTSIYGLGYDVVTGLEQDPVWLSFSADILHSIPNIFMSGLKSNPQGFSVFGDGDNTPFAPRYKNEYRFEIEIDILDELFYPVITYDLDACFLRTVQQIPLGSADTSIPEVAVEIVYERISSTLLSTPNRNPLQNGIGNNAIQNQINLQNSYATDAQKAGFNVA